MLDSSRKSGGMDSALRHYAPAQPYNNRGLVNQRNVSPTIPIGKLEEGATFTIPSTGFTTSASPRYGNPAFIELLRSVCGAERIHVAYEWKYDMRWQAQSILPFLYLGPGSSARDENFLRQAGITLLVAVRHASAAKARPSLLNPEAMASKLEIASMTLDIDNAYELRTKLAKSIKIINDHLEESCTVRPPSTLDDVKGRVLVYCETGSERSPVLIAAYLMVVCGHDAVTSLQVIQSQRFCLSSTDSMKEMLLSLGEYLDAEQEVAVATSNDAQADSHSVITTKGHSYSVQLSKPRKRDIAESYDDHATNQDFPEDNGMLGAPTRRPGQAPFADVD